MSQQEMNKILKEIDRTFSGIATFGATDEDHIQQVASALASASTTSYLGTIAFAGQRSAGRFPVQFNADGGSGYSSDWPEWAYDEAKSALLNDKKVWIISNGKPFGSNLVMVLVRSIST